LRLMQALTSRCEDEELKKAGYNQESTPETKKKHAAVGSDSSIEIAIKIMRQYIKKMNIFTTKALNLLYELEMRSGNRI
jgi:hypothetical protein